MYICLNIEKYYNHSNSKEYKGMSCFSLTEKIPPDILCENFVFKVFNASDNKIIKCDGQKIPIVPTKIKKIAFLGYSEYGTVKDEILLHTAMSSIQKGIVFRSYQTNSFQGIDDSETNRRSTPLFQLRGSDGQVHNIYYYIAELGSVEEVVQIDIPINLSLYIMAITLIIE